MATISDPSVDGIDFDDFGEEIDLVALFGCPAHMLEFTGAGTVTVLTEAGTERTWTVRDGRWKICGVRKILSVVGVTMIHAAKPRGAVFG